jgi:hypothetical protein
LNRGISSRIWSQEGTQEQWELGLESHHNRLGVTITDRKFNRRLGKESPELIFNRILGKGSHYIYPLFSRI